MEAAPSLRLLWIGKITRATRFQHHQKSCMHSFPFERRHYQDSWSPRTAHQSSRVQVHRDGNNSPRDLIGLELPYETAQSIYNMFPAYGLALTFKMTPAPLIRTNTHTFQYPTVNSPSRSVAYNYYSMSYIAIRQDFDVHITPRW